MAGAHNGNNAAGIEVGITERVQHQRSIGTLGKTAGILPVAITDKFYTLRLYELHLPLGMLHKRAVAEQLTQTGRGLGHNITNVIAILKQLLCTAYGFNEFPYKSKLRHLHP